MFICPICKEKLDRDIGVYKCKNNHSFDISKKGYVNLLLSNKSSARHHGDDKAMAISRREFLNKGYYKKLLDSICSKLGTVNTVLDAGCGECYYSEGMRRHFDKIGLHPEIYAVDISKDIISAASVRARENDIKIAVAGCSKIPLSESSIDIILSVFAPAFSHEFLRVLSENGKVIRVTPGKYHLFELKKAIYDNPKYNDEIDLTLDGFEIASQETVKYSFIAESPDIENLFAMTPYYYKTSPNDRIKLSLINSLEITAEFILTVYRKK